LKDLSDVSKGGGGRIQYIAVIYLTVLVIEGRKYVPRGPPLWPALLYDILGRNEHCLSRRTDKNHGNSVGIVGLISGQA
jgi:hypothetical protein